MNAPTSPRALSPEDEHVVTVMVLAVAAVAAVGSAGLLWARGAAWLIAHHVLLAPRAALVELPGASAGLDVPRTMIAAAALAAAMAAAASQAAWAWRTRAAGAGVR